MTTYLEKKFIFLEADLLVSYCFSDKCPVFKLGSAVVH